MATLTVQDAARRLGVKPAKVRTLIGARKPSAYPAPPGPGQRGDNHVLLDVDEVEALAKIRAHRRHVRATKTSEAAEPPATASDDDLQRMEALSGDVESITTGTFDHTGQRIALLVQSLLAPLVTELHDARETIRQQAEELGTLRATVADLKQRIQQPAPAMSAPSTTPHVNGAGRHESNEPATVNAHKESVVRPHPDRTAGAPGSYPWPRRTHLPLWQRAVTHLLAR